MEIVLLLPPFSKAHTIQTIELRIYPPMAPLFAASCGFEFQPPLSTASSPTPCETTTLFRSYTANYPILGFNQSDTFFAIKKPDGIYEIAVRRSHDLPLGIHDQASLGWI
jgi:hypothetical protein